MKRKYFHEIIQYWGFEHPFTIEFATAIENGANDAELAALYEDIIDRDDEIDDEIADEWRDEIADEWRDEIADEWRDEIACAYAD